MTDIIAFPQYLLGRDAFHEALAVLIASFRKIIVQVRRNNLVQKTVSLDFMRTRAEEKCNSFFPKPSATCKAKLSEHIIQPHFSTSAANSRLVFFGSL